MNEVLPLEQSMPAVSPDRRVTAKLLEAYETPAWAIEALLRVELLSASVIDPCCGTGSIAEAAARHGYSVESQDIHDWGYAHCRVQDWLTDPDPLKGDTTVIMNPPFSLACEFVDQAFAKDARKVVCFQRFAWWESAARRQWWAKRPPNRVYICGDRASCHRFDIPVDERKGNTPTAHAWFVWERGHPPGTSLGHIYRRVAL